MQFVGVKGGFQVANYEKMCKQLHIFKRPTVCKSYRSESMSPATGHRCPHVCVVSLKVSFYPPNSPVQPSLCATKSMLPPLGGVTFTDCLQGP